MKRLFIFHGSILANLLFLIYLTGCTPVIQPPQEFLGSISGYERYRLKIGLIVNGDLCKEEWEESIWVVPIGEWLCRNSEILAQNAFSDVVVFHDLSNSQLANVEALLTPKIVFMNRTQGATAFGESKIAIKVEWNLSLPNGKPIWIETISGNANGSTGGTDPKLMLRQALSDLLLNSQQAIATSESIKRFTSGLNQ